MEPAAILTLGMFATLAGLLMLGYPVALTLAGTAVLFGALGLALKAFLGVDVGALDAGYLGLFPERIFGTMTNEVLLAVPLFIAMGVMLERSKVAEDLLDAMARLFGSIRGGLGISVTIVGALLAASTGIVGATVVTMGLMSLPTMLKRGYDPALAAGSIAAAGTLGQIIPPSIVLVLLADVLSSAWQEAQREMGVWSPVPMSVGDLFAGALIPGLGLVLMYILYQVWMARFRPDSSPAMPRDEDEILDSAFYGRLLKALLPPMILILAVLGSILAGVATPTEAASVGAVGAILLGGIRLGTTGRPLMWAAVAALAALLVLAATGGAGRGLAEGAGLRLLAGGAATVIFILGLARALGHANRCGVLPDMLRTSVRISTMVFTILIGAALFSLVFRGFGGDRYIEAMLTGLPGGVLVPMILVMLVMFVLGFFLDFIEITFVVVPIVAPVLLTMGVHPVWLGVMMAMNLQTSFLTPPFGFSLFYLRGVAPDSVKTADIYRGVAPYVVIQLLGLLLIALVPELATWLPDVMFGAG
ncbi:MAG: TRAP transporter large permease subunit [Proteobacteria bacterium]|nr:TRAP transporter large permease subunit [Pseudomonadota bacterium]